jgi:hypothetical protein
MELVLVSWFKSFFMCLEAVFWVEPGGFAPSKATIHSRILNLVGLWRSTSIKYTRMSNIVGHYFLAMIL